MGGWAWLFALWPVGALLTVALVAGAGRRQRRERTRGLL